MDAQNYATEQRFQALEKRFDDFTRPAGPAAVAPVAPGNADRLAAAKLLAGLSPVHSHHHHVELCCDLKNHNCDVCKQQLAPLATNDERVLGYRCVARCDFDMCLECFAKTRVIKTKAMLRAAADAAAGAAVVSVVGHGAPVLMPPRIRYSVGEPVQANHANVVGARVKRGSNWRWGDQDGGANCKGTIITLADTPGWARVKWDIGGVSNTYRIGADDEFDLAYA